jgi:putative tryptophan/tyrosine transport system substrate-binding protein
MRRRAFVRALGAIPIALVTRTVAQERVRRIGLLMPSAEGDSETQHRLAVFRQALAALGWTEGKNVRIDVRWAVGEPARMAAAKELIALNPDIVIGASTPVTAALQRESRTTPIVFTQVGDPIGSGFAASFPSPGGNLTGFTNYEPAMATKWLQLLKEISPAVMLVGALFNPQTHSGQYWHALDTAARSVNLEFRKIPVQNVSELEEAIADLARQPETSLAVMPDVFVFNNRERIVSLAAQHRLPAIYPFRYFAEIGGLVAYGIDNLDMYKRAAAYADRILRGTPPKSLPIEAPKKFELIINLKTARSLGLDVPPTLLTSADEVIE